MSASAQLRWRPQANTRRARFSAWAMSIVFAAIAVISFAIDQTVDLSIKAGGGSGEAAGHLPPFHSWIDLVYNPFGRAE